MEPSPPTSPPEVRLPECPVCQSPMFPPFPTCLHCINFYRKYLMRDAKYTCRQQLQCTTNSNLPDYCPFCRVQKCNSIGLTNSSIYTLNPFNASTSSLSLIQHLLRIQRLQLKEHCDEVVYEERRAIEFDVNVTLQWSFLNAFEWASQFDTFGGLTLSQKKRLLGELTYAFLMIDQGVRTAREPVQNGYWLLQNGTFLHENYYQGEFRDHKVDPSQFYLHSKHVTFLHDTIRVPFQRLQLDDFEVAALKTLFLPEQRAACQRELMAYSARKHPETHVVRSAELFFLHGEIKNAVERVQFYTNATWMFDACDFREFQRRFFETL